MPEPGWSLDPQLARDAVPLGDLPLSRVLVMQDANYPWLLLVPRRHAVTELFDLSEPEQAQLMAEIARSAAALKAVTGCHKLNIAALGNVVAQLHVHVIARFRHDPAWPRPVWGQAATRPYAPAALNTFIAALRREIPLA